jgi:RNA polymerase sigma factor (sigma-70 family)
VSQETFFRLMQRPRLVTHSLAGWLHRTATHLALDVRRSEKSRKQREQTYGLEQQKARAAMPSWAEVSPYVDHALNEITEPVRGLLIRHFLQGVAQADLAAEMDVSPATMSRRIKTGLEQLQQNLRKKGIYLSLAVLAGFCSTHTHAAVPTALVAEMAKMNLVGMLKQLPATSAPAAANYPSPFPTRAQPSDFIPAKFGWALIGLTVVLALYTFAVASSWKSANPWSDQNTEPARAVHDR